MTTSENDKTGGGSAGTCDKKKKATQLKQTIQLEEINQKILAKEGR